MPIKKIYKVEEMNIKLKFSFFAGLFAILISCSPNYDEPILDLSSMQLLDQDLEISIVASEPLIIAPIAIDFDTKGRIWVAEMQDYMPDIDGATENIPKGRILILEDYDNDGIMDHSKIFKDKIHHLRSIRLFSDGLLYADDNKLYFVSIKNDLPQKIETIDSLYAVGGNVEHKANGLLKNIDNCFYNAKSNSRYCYNNQAWKKEPTSFRGQWGITTDENGRLYANSNSNFLFGDQFLPNTLIKNKYLINPEELTFDIIRDRSIKPIHATSVNRAYQEGVVDSLGRLKKITSACGPHIFQSDALGIDYQNAAFICVPEANLIKHLIFDPQSFKQEAKFANQTQEFLASNDEGFRPVNICSGPDGSLFIVDMHRGILQHKTYMTQFLRNETLEKGLDTIINYGRILKIKSKLYNTALNAYNFENEQNLLEQLGSNNAWIRNKSQEILINLESKTLDKALEKILFKGNKIEKLHALWTLVGRQSLPSNFASEITINEDPWLIANYIKSLDGYYNPLKKTEILDLFKKFSKSNNEIVLNHLLTSLSLIKMEFPKEFNVLLSKIMNKTDIEILPNAIITAFPSGELMDTLTWENSNYSNVLLLNKKVSEVNENVNKKKMNFIYDEIKASDQISKSGISLYNSSCSPCHGFGGNGINALAPSLVKGKLVNSNKSIVPLIIINGLHGEITVNNEKVSFASEMPKFEKGSKLSTREITKITNYIYNAFREDIVRVNDSLVDELILKYGQKNEMWTESSLLNLFPSENK